MFQCRHPATRDEVTLLDCKACDYRPRTIMPDARRLLLVNKLCPGDVLCMTAAVHSLHRANPGRFQTAVFTTCPAIWEFNPDVLPEEVLRSRGDVEQIDMHYPLVHQSNQRAVHVLAGYCEYLENKLGVRVPLLTNRPLVYLSHQERSWLNQVQQHQGYTGKFWVVNAGFKDCFTAKAWPYYQGVVDRLQGKIQFVQVGKRHHRHDPLRGVIDLLGQTDDRQLLRLVYHAQGVLTGVSFPMHLAAALQKPCVTIAGGREPRVWNSYPLQELFCSVGQLPCCKTDACWRSRTVALHDGAEADGAERLCLDAVPVGASKYPRCMAEIKAEEVAAAILKYSA